MHSTRFLATGLMTVSFVMQTITPIAAYAQYVDQSAYSAAVMSLQQNGIIDTVPDVRLRDTVNRAEALKIILLAKQSYAAEVESIRSSLPAIPLFPDVNQTAWYAPYVEAGFRNGLIKGYPNGRLMPQNGVKVVEAAAMLARSYGENIDGAPFLTSTDLPNQSGQWYTGIVSAVLARNAVMPGTRLSAGNFMTRGQLFDMVYRMREAHTGGASALSVTPSSNEAQFASAKLFAITIPSLGIVDLTITHPDDPFTQEGVLDPLQVGVGHLFSYPGAGGKIMVYGHSSGYPWDLSEFTKIFRGINKLVTGDRIYVTYEGKLHIYQVTNRYAIQADDETRFEPDDNGEELILYTCWPPDSISQRLLVVATPIDTIALR